MTDLEIGAFCLAMRIKGETAQEMAGFLDATHQRLHRLPASTGRPTIVIPSYNGARKLPVLTPLLALLLASGPDAASTAAYIRSVLDGTLPVPAPIAQQVAHILLLVNSL